MSGEECGIACCRTVSVKCGIAGLRTQEEVMNRLLPQSNGKVSDEQNATVSITQR